MRSWEWIEDRTCNRKSISKQVNGDKRLEATNNNKMNSFLLISPNVTFLLLKNKSKSSIVSHSNSAFLRENQQRLYKNFSSMKPKQLAISWMKKKDKRQKKRKRNLRNRKIINNNKNYKCPSWALKNLKQIAFLEKYLLNKPLST